MGASQFSVVMKATKTVQKKTRGKAEWTAVQEPLSEKEAFNEAVSRAQYEDGHGGYTGTIAEKHSFKRCGHRPTVEEAQALADKLMDEDDSRISDKWGPAGSIAVTDEKGDTSAYVFFGWASS